MRMIEVKFFAKWMGLGGAKAKLRRFWILQIQRGEEVENNRIYGANIF